MVAFLAPLFGALGTSAGLTAAATVGGALIDARAQNKANRQNKELNDPVYARERLEAAGFNPGVKYNGYQAAQMVAPQVGSIISQGMAAAADQMQVDRQQEIQLAQLEMENQRLNQQVQASKLNPHVNGIYTHDGSPKSTDSGSPRDILGRDGDPERGDVTVTNPGDRGKGTYVNPRILDAEASEQRYAEIGSNIAGIRSIWADNDYNESLQLVVKRYGRDVANEVHAEFAKADKRSLDQVIAQVTKGKPLKIRPKARPDGLRAHPERLRQRVFNPLYSQY